MAAALDYKKTLRELYGPGTTPSILTVPPANYAAVRGRGDPNREEGECCQCMHLGPFDDEPATMARMEAYAAEHGRRPDHSEARRHHEIYLSDPRKCAPEKLRTVLRVPVAPL